MALRGGLGAFCIERLQGDHVLETGPVGNGDRRIGNAGILVADVFDEQQDQHVVLVLAGVHPATQLVAA